MFDETFSAGLFFEDCSILSGRRLFTYLFVEDKVNQILTAVQKVCFCGIWSLVMHAFIAYNVRHVL